jgi:UDP-N-acetylmuramoyl-tripeptide--D-alanyl-D-alanine ligase
VEGVNVQTIKESMVVLKLNEILEATGGRLLCGMKQEFSGLSIDSRTIKKGELFIPLKGEHFDGHDFIHEALNIGAGALVHVPPPNHLKGKTIIYVKNTLLALHNIARFLRSKIDAPAFCITGTNGKTTVKELISLILSQRFKVLKTTGNLNNHIGLPLSISRMHGDETVIVAEMGSNAEGDIKTLCEIVYPDFGVVTNVGPAHLEGFGSLDMVRKTDLEIVDYVKVISLNADDTFLIDGVKNFRGSMITYGLKEKADVYASDIALKERNSAFSLWFPDGKMIQITLNVAGRFNISNALAAASITHAFGIDPRQIKDGLESFEGVPMRLEIKDFRGALLISDVYNANPASMEEAIRELVRQKRRRTIAVIGDMLELGPYAEEAHKEVVKKLSDLSVDVLIAVGPEMQKASSAFKGICHTSDTADTAGEILSSMCKEGDTVLVKGSRGMLMENVVQTELDDGGRRAL